ncbi:MAG: DUF72 domain-containing protein [candidate division WOR-3 bacterium]|nr:DUF72 domain-containing protein [candidate division WOR-3 bacterium]MCX7757954.1 DUF72 domain-containing protein [candidate division WOR-3 bacterium]MDW7987301.1 DUF72 domain-containing protein [candidate division WOR-3 bacterium]
MPEVYVGTSGWFYSWNPERTLDWYIANSKLNSIELNASFYRFPFPNQIKSWAKKSFALRWAIKVSRRITHLDKFNSASYEIWQSFYELFSPLEDAIDFYLFQLPPSFTPESLLVLEKFIKKTDLKEKFALEVRNSKWFKDEYLLWAKDLKITWVSISAPKLPDTIYNTNGIVYLRFHGKDQWYQYCYSKKELKDFVQRILKVAPKKIYAFFNNDQDMLTNAQTFKNLLEKALRI